MDHLTSKLEDAKAFLGQAQALIQEVESYSFSTEIFHAREKADELESALDDAISSLKESEDPEEEGDI